MTKDPHISYSIDASSLGACFADDVNLKGEAPNSTLIGLEQLTDYRNKFFEAMPSAFFRTLSATPLAGDSVI